MSAPQFVVVVEGATAIAVVFGPFDDREEADRFAKFATQEIDPAMVRTLVPPVAELLNWRDLMTQEGTDAHPF